MHVGAGTWLGEPRGLQSAGVGRDAANGCAVRVDTRSGHAVVVDGATKILVGRGYEAVRLPASCVVVGDHAAIQYGGGWPTGESGLGGFAPGPSYGSQERIRLPRSVGEQLAFLLGAYVAEGHTTRSNWTVIWTNSVHAVLRRIASTIESTFGIRARVVHPGDRCPYVRASSKTLVEFFDHLGVGENAHTKRIPQVVMRSPRAHVRSFLQGLWLDAYTSWMGRTPKWAITVASQGLLDDLQILLTRLGIVHGRCEKHDRTTGSTFGEVYGVGPHAQELIRLVDFLEPDKAARAEEKLAAEPAQSTADVVPIIRPSRLREMIPPAPRGQRQRSQFGFLGDRRTKHVSRRTLERVAELQDVNLPLDLADVLSLDRHFTPVVDTQTQAAMLVDIDRHEAVANGFLISTHDT